MPCSCVTTAQSGNPVSGIHLKMGHPLSTPCERATVIGSIPEVIRFPNFTTVGGQVVTATSRTSNGGIAPAKMASFFKPREGCYYSMEARLAGCCVDA